MKAPNPLPAVTLLLPLLLASALEAQEWTRFRGPNGTGVGAADSLPAAWSPGAVDWRVEVPGTGHAQPVIWGERVFLTSSEGEGAERLVLCLRARDGATEWTRRLASVAHEKHLRNSHASSTPAVDGERLYVVFGSPSSLVLRAFDHQGAELWLRDLGPFKSQHGVGASPILVDDLVVLPNEQDGESSVIALEARTGHPRWTAPRRTAETAYGTPCLQRDASGRAELILSSHAHGLSSLDPRTGALNWEAAVFDKRTCSSPIIAGGLAIGTCGSGGGGNFLVAVRLGGKGDVTATHLAYKLNRSIPYVPTPLAIGDLLFLWGDQGVVSCVEAAAGKVLWQERVEGSFAGSPVAAGGKIYSLSEEGDVVVVAAERKFRLLARNALGEGSHSTPAIAGGRLYLRTFRHLTAVSGKKPAGGPAEER
jgi:outer membrane protein assembly factor BamB